MTISALPEPTARAIGSILVLNDACAVVKELLENALDAKATTIAVEISANTLDIIQVKDNGCGISPDDRKHIGKRSHTSKIETLEDLHCVGGNSLGFRGEALWSIGELSRTVLVTTRTHGEVVGETFDYAGSGNLASPTKTSHPIGTSIKVHDFLHKIPVRRQTALKSPTKTLNNIKKLLQHYALARPGVRLSVRVLKGKDQKLNWTYAPKQDATISDAAVQVVGQDTCVQCVSRNSTSEDSLTAAVKKQNDTGQSVEEANDGGKTSIAVLLPRDDGDLSKIANGGQYISIDQRPLSSARGLPKEIVRLFKSYLQSFLRRSGSQAPLSNPFLCLHMYCPRGSYDVNVEPAKDNVLFGDTTIVLGLVESLFKQTYGTLERDGPSTTRPNHKNLPRDEDFSLFLSRKPLNQRERDKSVQSNGWHEHASTDPAFHQQLPINGKASKASQDALPSVSAASDSLMPIQPLHDSSRTTWSASTMYRATNDDTDEDIEVSTPPNTTTETSNESSETLDESELRSARVTNPWSLARLHTKIKPRQSPDASKTASHANKIDLLSELDDGFSQARTPSHDLQTPTISPTPRQNPGPPRRPWNHNTNLEHESWANGEPGRAFDGSQVPEQQLRQTIMGDRFSTSSLTSNERSRQLNVGEGRFSPPKRSRGRLKPGALELDPDFASDNDLYQQSEVQTTAKSSHQNSHLTSPIRRVNPPFFSPLKSQSPPSAALHPRSNLNQSNISPTSSLSLRRMDSESISPQPSSSQSTLVAQSPAPSQTLQPTLASLMDYEHRKKALIASQREQNRRETAPNIDLCSNDNNNKTTEQQKAENAAIAKRFTSSPHQNRYQAARAALLSAENPSSSKPLKLPDYDPRQYLMRNQDSLNHTNDTDNPNPVDGASKLKPKKRLKSALLPLESTPPDLRLHYLDAFLPPEHASSAPAIREQADRLQGTDAYLASGELGLVSERWGDVQDAEVLGRWERRIRGMVGRRMRERREVDLAVGDVDVEGLEMGMGFEMDLAECLRKGGS